MSEQIVASPRTPTFIHKCTKCQRDIVTYRNCNGEHHGLENRGAIRCGGSIQLIKEVTLEEAKAANLVCMY